MDTHLEPAEHLLIDVGNTFVKWSRHRIGKAGSLSTETFIAGDRVLLDEITALADAFRAHPSPRRVVVSNVAGTRVRTPLLRALEVWPAYRDAGGPAHWLASSETLCGVVNGYRNPAQLGTDRWAALIGARTLLPELPVLVVVCGTATTVDLLSPEGRFLGGNILPGMGLMLRSLHTNTAALPDADGDYLNHPTQTVDAITSGCQHAQAGAIERLFRRHRAEFGDLACVISGGAGRTVAPRLSIPYRFHDNIVLEGLHRVALNL
ncbi:MAG: type III pantothenate kinase [Burkholderiales bacterium]